MPKGIRNPREDYPLGSEGGGGGGGGSGGGRYLIQDTKTGTYKNYEGYSTASRARNAADKLDNDYGAYRYRVVPYSKATEGSFEQPKAKRENPNLFEMSDAKRAELTPAQLNKYGSDATFKKGGKVSSASSRADGIAQRGKTKGRKC